MKEITSEKRVNGGTGWADAVFRKSADSNTYARIMIDRIICKSKFDKCGFDYFSSFDEFTLMKGDKVIVRMSFDEVEEHRSSAVFSYEEYMKKKILQYA